MTLANLDATGLEVEFAGISTVRASGTVDRRTVTLPAIGFGAYEAKDLQSLEAHVYVHGQIDATITGTGRVVQIAEVMLRPLSRGATGT